MISDEILSRLKALANPEKAKLLSGYFKCGKWEYWEGDIFLGINVPDLRKIASEYKKDITLQDIDNLLTSEIHETRMCWTLSLVALFDKNEKNLSKNEIFEFYISKSKRMNNWDLVDVSAPKISWALAILDKDAKNKLETFSKSKNIWERRIAIVSTLAFIKAWDVDFAMKISKILLNDSEDLIRKAVWWMLREAWKINPKTVEDFLLENYSSISRTTLRYAIERMEEEKRLTFLNKGR